MGPPGVSAPFKEIFFFALLKKCACPTVQQMNKADNWQIKLFYMCLLNAQKT